MNEYIDRNELLKNINKKVAEAHNERCSQLLEAILNAPTANVVEVVRCKDCKYHHREKGNWCELHDFEFDTNGYCSDGEKK